MQTQTRCARGAAGALRRHSALTRRCSGAQEKDFKPSKRIKQPRHHHHLYPSERRREPIGTELLQLAVGWFAEPLRAAGLGAVRFKVVVRDAAEADPV